MPTVAVEQTLMQDLLASFSKAVFRRPIAPRVSFRSQQANDRPMVQNGAYSPVYDTPRSGDFNTRVSRMPMFRSFALQQYFAVMRDEFLPEVDTEQENMGASTPDGEQLPWVQRSNVARPPAVAYGSMVIMQPDDPYLTLRSRKG